MPNSTQSEPHAGDHAADDSPRTTIIRNVRIFDGKTTLDASRVTIADGVITAIDGPDESEAEIVDGRNQTLIPGLIDAHVHPTDQGLRQAVTFGVTTVIEMGGAPRDAAGRARIVADDTLADILSAGPPLTAECGHPNQLLVSRDQLFNADGTAKPEAQVIPGLADPSRVSDFVAQRVRSGSDFIKLLAEEGTVLASPGLPELDESVFAAAVQESHRQGKLAVAHALTYDKTLEMLRVKADGFSHIFLDRPHTTDLIDLMATSGVFVIPCLVLNRSITGTAADDLADDPRVDERLPDNWKRALRRSFSTWVAGDFSASSETVSALHEAGVPILAGTDTAVAEAAHGGLAMGASLHHELQLLVDAGLSAEAALRAATSVPAEVFGLRDRGMIREGYRADLVLVDGDPTTDIASSLSTRAVWRRGAMTNPISI